MTARKPPARAVDKLVDALADELDGAVSDIGFALESLSAPYYALDRIGSARAALDRAEAAIRSALPSP